MTWRHLWQRSGPAFILSLVLGLSLIGASMASDSFDNCTPLEARVEPSHPAFGKPAPRASTAITTTAATAGMSVPPKTFETDVTSIAGSGVTTDNCYQADLTQVLCFTVENGSTDSEWLDRVRLTFPGNPPHWEVSCYSQDATDSSGNPANLACSNSFDYEVLFIDNDNEMPNIGEITAGSTWGFCVTVTVPSGYEGPRLIHWGLSGDEQPGSQQPHDITGTLAIEECTPVMLTPASMSIEGCNGASQTLIFHLWNNTDSNGTFDLTYDVPSGKGVFTGPASFDLSKGEIVTFTTEFMPDLCLQVGEELTAVLQATGNSFSDSSAITETISRFSGWVTQTASPVPAMDNVVIWAIHDGGLWSIGGYGADGATQRYDPDTNTWITHTTAMSPTIEYPSDGCYGLNAEGHEVVVLFPDTTSLTDTLHIYDITADQWYTAAIPAGYPAEGRWAHDIVSLYGLIGENVCYLSGGSEETGGGHVKDLWRYRPDLNQTEYLGPFTHHVGGVNFHASWYVPWIGNSGAICVGGGIDRDSNVLTSTQCYDLETASFNEPNADLGPLPEPWWGMADGWRTARSGHQIWIANGVAKDGTLLPASAYADATTGGFVYGPDLPIALYRLEGDGWMGAFYVEQGAAGGFNYSTYNQTLVPCPECYPVYLPLLLKEHTP